MPIGSRECIGCVWGPGLSNFPENIMPISFVHYDLVDGYIDNWLVAGPQSNNITKLEFSNDENFKKTLTRHCLLLIWAKNRCNQKDFQTTQKLLSTYFLFSLKLFLLTLVLENLFKF